MRTANEIKEIKLKTTIRTATSEKFSKILSLLLTIYLKIFQWQLFERIFLKREIRDFINNNYFFSQNTIC